MTGTLGFTVKEVVRPTEPVVPDPFVAALEPERGEDGAKARPEGRLAAGIPTP
jgi:hypothetical protein